MRYVAFSKQALKDVKKLRSAGLAAKAKRLSEVLQEDPFKVPPAYEALVGNLEGFYSRRISYQHRLVYQVEAGEREIGGASYDGVVKVARMWSHYEGLPR